MSGAVLFVQLDVFSLLCSCLSCVVMCLFCVWLCLLLLLFCVRGGAVCLFCLWCRCFAVGLVLFALLLVRLMWFWFVLCFVVVCCSCGCVYGFAACWESFVVLLKVGVCVLCLVMVVVLFV